MSTNLGEPQHPNLIGILGGGKCTATNHLYVVMEHLDWPALDSVVRDVPRNRIRPLIAQLAGAAQFLEEQNLVHRDIKPSNIAISSDFETLKLLDLGVMKPIGEGGLTDLTSNPFLGTHQYSPPEFIFRYEDNELNGWRAVTFYQIGAVLYDLLMRRPIFDDASHLISTLVVAVENTQPVIDAPDVDPDLKSLALICLSKHAALRSQILTWEWFSRSASPSTVVEHRERLKHLQRSKAAPTPATPTDGANRLFGTVLTLRCNYPRKNG